MKIKKNSHNVDLLSKSWLMYSQEFAFIFSHFIYPSQKCSERENGIQNGANGIDAEDDGKYELFGQMNTHVKNQIKSLVLNRKWPSGDWKYPKVLKYWDT